MKKDQVPQDECKSYSGHRKLVYATDDQGHYQGVKSSGWDVEGYATEMAVREIDQQIEKAKQALLNGEISPIGYYMPKLRFDIVSLAQATGFFQWQIKRHIRPNIFLKLSPKKLDIYCDIFKLTPEQLKNPKIEL